MDISRTSLKIFSKKLSNLIVSKGVKIGKNVGLYVIRIENIGKFNLVIENEKSEVIFEKEIIVSEGDIKNIDAKIVTTSKYEVGNPILLTFDIRSTGYKSYEISYDGPNHLEIIKDEIVEGFSYVYILPNLPGDYNLYFGRHRASHIKSIKFNVEPIDINDLELKIPIFEFGRHIQTGKLCKIPILSEFGFNEGCLNYPSIFPKVGEKYEFDLINSSMQELPTPTISKLNSTVIYKKKIVNFYKGTIYNKSARSSYFTM